MTAGVTTVHGVILVLINPKVPETVKPPVLGHKVPGAFEAAVKVSVDVAVPLAGGVTDDGENEYVTPVGPGAAVRETAELKPRMLVTVMVEVAVLPAFTAIVEGLAESVNVCWAEKPLMPEKPLTPLTPF